MLKLTSVLFFGLALTAAEKPTDTDKLHIREAQLVSVSELAQLAQLEGRYREAKAAFDKAQVVEQAAIAELGKRLGCIIDSKTVECKPAAQESTAKAK